MDDLIKLMLIALIVGVPVVYVVLHYRCHKCTKLWALKEVGKRVVGPGWFMTEIIESKYQCKYCGHILYRKSSARRGT
jgi:DNA-directed RNA polymerase subunit RPC12/RpoP